MKQCYNVDLSHLAVSLIFSDITTCDHNIIYSHFMVYRSFDLSGKYVCVYRPIHGVLFSVFIVKYDRF